MLKIGFSTVFYTLWDVSSEIIYSNSTSEGNVPYDKTTYVYCQNLSKDLTTAIEKAKARGVKDLEPDTDLYGRNTTWSIEKKLFSILPNTINPFFEFGKYAGRKIMESTDINYLVWYFEQTKNRYAKQVLISSGLVEFEGNLYSEANYKKVLEHKKEADSFRDFIVLAKRDEGVEIEFIADSNLSGNGYMVYKNIPVHFPLYKTMYYNGYEYALPCLNEGSTAKRIKNKNIRAVVKYVEDSYNDRGELHVKSFEIY